MRKLVISPHPDDAVLSCSGILDIETLVVTPFSISRYGWQSFDNPLHEISSRRKQEDRSALEENDATIKYLDLPDTSARNRYSIYADGTEGRLFAALCIFFQQLAHTYDFKEIWAPAGVGDHVDHRLCSLAASSVFTGCYYWLDLPYACDQYGPQERYCQRLEPSRHKSQMLLNYQSQLDETQILSVLTFGEWHLESPFN